MNPDVVFGSRTDTWMTPCTSHTILQDSHRASLIQGQYGCLLSNKGYSRGLHKWKLRIHSRTSTCMIGVAPSTVHKTGAYNNYNTNGFYMDLNNGMLYSGPPFSYSGRAGYKAVNTGSILTIILDCNRHTLTYNVDGQDYLAYENIPDQQLYLAWDNNTTGGSDIELI